VPDRSITYRLGLDVSNYVSNAARAAGATEVLDKQVSALGPSAVRANAQLAAAAGTGASAAVSAGTRTEGAATRAAAAASAAATTQVTASGRTGAAATAAAEAATVAAATTVAAGDRATSSTVTGASQQSAAHVRSAASLREKLGLQALEGPAADRSAAANSRAAQSAAVFAAAIDRGNIVLAAEVPAAAASTAAVRANTAAREQATLAARVQQTTTGALASANGMLGTSLSPLTAGLGATALALGYSAYRGMEFGSAMSQVQAASQETGATLDQLRTAAIKAGADTQYSGVEAAQGITEMSKAGVAATDILGGGLTGALNLAAAGQISVAEAAETGATALSVFQLRGDQMSHVADLLAAGAGKAQGSVGDMSAALNQSALVASQAGLSIEDTAGSLAMFASNGLVGSDSGTSFKTMLQALTPNSKAAAEAMSAIGFSAFDAQGNFVGMESVAGQLRSGLSGLTEQQRNSTLETIFGSDAVRAASVLYKEGSTGVAEWAGKVNDAGYAQRQAAQLTDNLRGDLERLGGAADSVFTTIGGGTQGALREAVQALTAVVNVGGDVIGFFTSLPGPVQAGLLALTGFVALRGPADALFTRLAVGLTSTVTGMGMTVAGAGGARAALLGLLGTAAPFAAIAAITYGISQIVQFANAGDEARESVEQLSDSIDDADGNGAAFQATTSGIDDLRDKIGELRPFVSSWAQENRSFFERAFVPVTGEVQDARESLDIYQDKLAELEAAQTRYGQNVDVLTQHYRIGKDDVVAFADAHGIDLSGSLQIAQSDFIRLAGASMASGDAMVNGKNQAEDYQASLEETADSASNASKQIDLLKTSLDVLAGANATLSQAEAAVYDAMGRATDAIKENGGEVLNQAGALNLQTENGRAALDVLLAYTDTANNQIGVLEQQGRTVGEVTAKEAELRQGFMDTAARMGITGQAAIDLANRYYGLPEERRTQITADTAQATAAAAALQRSIDNMRGRTLQVLVETVNVGGGTLQGSYTTASGGRARGSAYNAAGGIIHAYADGGFEPMAGGFAQIVAADTWRIIGDRITDREAYIPINGSDRSAQILAATARDMGYAVVSRTAAATSTQAAPTRTREMVMAPGGGGSGPAFDYDRLAAAIGGRGPLLSISEWHSDGETPGELAEALGFSVVTRNWE